MDVSARFPRVAQSLSSFLLVPSSGRRAMMAWRPSEKGQTEKARPTPGSPSRVPLTEQKGKLLSVWRAWAGDPVLKNNLAFLRPGQEFTDNGQPPTAHGPATMAQNVACTHVLGQVPARGRGNTDCSQTAEWGWLSGTSVCPGRGSPPPAGSLLPGAGAASILPGFKLDHVSRLSFPGKQYPLRTPDIRGTHVERCAGTVLAGMRSRPGPRG